MRTHYVCHALRATSSPASPLVCRAYLSMLEFVCLKRHFVHIIYKYIYIYIYIYSHKFTCKEKRFTILESLKIMSHFLIPMFTTHFFRNLLVKTTWYS